MQHVTSPPRWTPPRIPLAILSLLVVGLNAFDGLATLRACRVMGVEELNPVLAPILAFGGPVAFMAVKTLGVALAIAFLARAMHHPRVSSGMRKFAWGGLIVLNLVYSALFVWQILIMTGRISPPVVEYEQAQSASCEIAKNRP